MSLKIIKLGTIYVRLLVIASSLACIAGGFVFAKWCFANSISVRGDLKEVADLAVQLGPSDPQTHYFAAMIYDNSFNESDLARSLDEYEKAVALLPNNYVLWLDLGKARERSGDNVGSEAALSKALELAPNYAVVSWAFGNFLLRRGKTDEGFAKIANSVASNPEYAAPAAIAAWQIYDGDMSRIRQVLGDSAETNAALTATLIGIKRYEDAFDAWSKLEPDDKKIKFKQLGDTLIGQFIEAKKYRLAASVIADTQAEGGDRPVVGQITNGGFENGVKLRNAGTFDWQIADGVEPQIGLNEEQKHTGIYSIFIKFSVAPTAVTRQLSQTVAVESGKSYILEGFFRAELSGPVVWAVVDATTGKILGKSAPLQSSTTWANFRAEFKVPETSDGVIIRLVNEGCASPPCPISGRAWFDDLSIKQNDVLMKTQ